jgi:hypothetical protein
MLPTYIVTFTLKKTNEHIFEAESAQQKLPIEFRRKGDKAIQASASVAGQRSFTFKCQSTSAEATVSCFFHCWPAANGPKARAV